MSASYRNASSGRGNLGTQPAASSIPGRKLRADCLRGRTFFTDLPFKRVARRGPVNTPVEIDLRQHTDVKIVCIPPGVNPFDPPMALGANGTKQAQ